MRVNGIYGIPQPSVGKIISAYTPKPMLLQWAVNLAIDHIKSNALAQPALPNSGEECEYHIDASVLQSALKSHESVRDESADDGSDIHDAIARFISNKTYEQSLKSEQNNIAFNNFLEFVKITEMKFVESEKIVSFHDEEKEISYCGRFDFVCDVFGGRYMVDCKTGGAVYPEAWLQVVAYMTARENMIGQIKHGLDDMNGNIEPHTDTYDKMNFNGFGILHVNSKSGEVEFTAYDTTHNMKIIVKNGELTQKDDSAKNRKQRLVDTFQSMARLYFIQANRIGIVSSKKIKGNPIADKVSARYKE